MMPPAPPHEPRRPPAVPAEEEARRLAQKLQSVTDVFARMQALSAATGRKLDDNTHAFNWGHPTPETRPARPRRPPAPTRSPERCGDPGTETARRFRGFSCTSEPWDTWPLSFKWSESGRATV